MEESNQFSVKDASIKNGITLGLVLTVYFFILTFAGQAGNQTLGYINYLIIGAFIFLGHKSYKENGSGFMSFGAGLGIGTLTTLLGSIISIIITYFYVKFVDDSMIAFARDKAIEDLEKRGMSGAEMDQAMGFAETFLKPEVMFPIAMVVTVFMGFVISIIITIFTNKKDPSLEL